MENNASQLFRSLKKGGVIWTLFNTKYTVPSFALCIMVFARHAH